LVCIDLYELQTSSVEELTRALQDGGSPFYAGARPTQTFQIPSSLQAGPHEIRFPEEFARVEELFLITRVRAPKETDPAYAIIEARPTKGTVHVYPQRWFTSARLDLGYQWIARAARDPTRGRIVGDGVRIDPFELSADGCELASDGS